MIPQPSSQAPAARTDRRAGRDDDPVYRKVTARLMPFLLVCFALACIDRYNIGMAQLRMRHDLGFTDLVYGLGAGMFFVGYVLFELPSNLLLARIGVRKTLLRIMVCWGLTSAATLFVRTPAQFYAARFLLGVFEAGFFPGILLYLTYWYPPTRLARVSAYFLSAGAVAGLVTSPLSAWIIVHLDGLHGWRGWQWMFAIEGLPSTVLGVAAYLYLDDGPQQAAWLSPHERALIVANVHRARPDAGGTRGGALRRILTNRAVYRLGAVYFSLMWVAFGLAFWGPALIHSLGVSGLTRIGLYGALPAAAGIVAMIAAARHSDATGERRWHYVAAVGACAVGLAVAAWNTGRPTTSFGVLLATGLMVGTGLHAAMPVFWALPSACLPRADAAAGIALINCLGIVSGVASPWMMGFLKTRTDSLAPGLALMIGWLVLGAALVPPCASRAAGEWSGGRDDA